MIKYFLYLMSFFYFFAGLNHFINPEFYLKMMPSYLPFHDLLNITSGIFEILLALLLLNERSRKLACIGIIFLLIAVFPANINMLIQAMNGAEANIHTIALWIRLPIQFVFIYWAWAVRDYRSQKHLGSGQN